MEIINRTTDQLKVYDKNARTHPQKQIDLLAKNIERFSFTTPVLINGDNEIIAGHGRVLAMKQLGRDDIPCVLIEGLTKEEEKALRLADNQIGLMSEWDMGLALDELNLLPNDLQFLTGFDLDLLMTSDPKDDEVPELPETPKSVLGDLYELGEHRILCGSATSLTDIERLMNGQRADMVFTDPPYNIDYSGDGKNTNNKILNDKMSRDDFRTFMRDTFAGYITACKDSARYYVCHSSSSQRDFEDMMEENGLKVKNQIIWNKKAASMGWGDYRWKHEPIFYATLNGKAGEFYGDRKQYTVWDIGKDSDYIHPTQKPLDLILKAIVNSSKSQDLVIDFFQGSGSTLIAAEKSNRICYGIELDPKYVDCEVTRYVKFTGNNKIKINGKESVWDLPENSGSKEHSKAK